MPGTFEGQKHISVFETTLSIQQNTLSVSLYKFMRYALSLINQSKK